MDSMYSYMRGGPSRQLWQQTPPSSETDDTESAAEDSTDDEYYDSDVESASNELDSPLRHYFEIGASVWVNVSSTWYKGKVFKSIPVDTKHRKVLTCRYDVIFKRGHCKLRAIFDPLEGNMKPDTPHYRKLLQRRANVVS